MKRFEKLIDSIFCVAEIVAIIAVLYFSAGLLMNDASNIQPGETAAPRYEAFSDEK